MFGIIIVRYVGSAVPPSISASKWNVADTVSEWTAVQLYGCCNERAYAHANRTGDEAADEKEIKSSIILIHRK